MSADIIQLLIQQEEDGGCWSRIDWTMDNAIAVCYAYIQLFGLENNHHTSSPTTAGGRKDDDEGEENQKVVDAKTNLQRLEDFVIRTIEKNLQSKSNEGDSNSNSTSLYSIRWVGFSYYNYSIYSCMVLGSIIPLLNYVYTKGYFEINDVYDAHNEFTALHRACITGNIPLVKYLLTFPTVDLTLKSSVRDWIDSLLDGFIALNFIIKFSLFVC